MLVFKYGDPKHKPIHILLHVLLVERITHNNSLQIDI